MAIYFISNRTDLIKHSSLDYGIYREKDIEVFTFQKTNVLIWFKPESWTSNVNVVMYNPTYASVVRSENKLQESGHTLQYILGAVFGLCCVVIVLVWLIMIFKLVRRKDVLD